MYINILYVCICLHNVYISLFFVGPFMGEKNVLKQFQLAYYFLYEQYIMCNRNKMFKINRNKDQLQLCTQPFIMSGRVNNGSIDKYIVKDNKHV